MTIAEQITAKAKEYREYTAKNLSRIIKMKSLSGGEKDVAYAIKEMMEEAGFDDARIDGLGNIIGRIGNGKKIIATDGHIDTVDLGNLENWDFDPLEFRIPPVTIEASDLTHWLALSTAAMAIIVVLSPGGSTIETPMASRSEGNESTRSTKAITAASSLPP